MGKAYSHLNLWALSCIMRADADVLMEAYKMYETSFVSSRLAQFEITADDFHTILINLEMHPSDIDIFEDIFSLLDVRNRGISDMRSVCISLTPFVCKSIEHMYTLCFALIDRGKINILSKEDVVLVMKLLNNTVSNVGDRPLAQEVLADYVNSVYTSAGRIDGDIYYPDYLETFSAHPVIQLFLSPQFQGTLVSKLMTDEEIDARYKIEY